MGNGFSRSLAEAAVSGDHQRLDDLLLSADAKKLKAPDSDGWTPLHYASAAGDGAAVALLLSHEEDSGREAVGRRAKDGSTPLHLAAASSGASSGGSADAVSQLLKAGAEADALDGRGRSPLVVAAATVSPSSSPPDNQSSSSSSSSGAVILALVAAGADATRALPDGTTPLHLAAIRGNAPAVAALLAAPGVSRAISAGAAAAAAAPRSRRTPLHEAAASGSLECARLLLRAGADPRAQDARGKTPASVALDAGHGKVAVELAEGIKGSTGAGWWSGVGSRNSKEKTSYPTLHGSSVAYSPYAPQQQQQQQMTTKQGQRTAAQTALEKEWGGAGTEPSDASLSRRPLTAAMAAAADAAFGGWADAALAPPPPPVASRVAAALAALSASATDAASGVAGASKAAAASAASAASAATAAAAAAASSARASLRAAAAARAEESVEGVPTAPMGAVKSVYEVDAQLRATFAEKKKEEKEKEKETPKEKEEASLPAAAVAVAPPAAAAAAAAPVETAASSSSSSSSPALLPSLDFGTLAVATRGFGETSRIGGSARGVTFAGTLSDGTKVAVKVLDPASAPPGQALAGLLLRATGGGGDGGGFEGQGVLDRPIAVGPTSRAIVTRLAEGGSLDGALRGAPLPAAGAAGAAASPAPPPRLSWAERLDLLAQVAGVLSGLHAQGLAHGSLSATNVLLDPVVEGQQKQRRRFTARVGDAGVAAIMAAASSSSSPAPSSSAAEKKDTAALGTMILQSLCGAEGEGLAESVARLVGEGGGRSASSLAEKGLVEIGAETSKKKKKKNKNKNKKDETSIVPGASRAVSLALDCVAGRVSAEEAARALSELAEGVRSGELLLKEEEEETEKAKAKAAASVEAAAAAPAAAAEQQQQQQQPEQAPAAFLDDYEDVAGELSALEAELAALPSAPGGRAKEKEKELAEAAV